MSDLITVTIRDGRVTSNEFIEMDVECYTSIEDLLYMAEVEIREGDVWIFNAGRADRITDLICTSGVLFITCSDSKYKITDS